MKKVLSIVIILVAVISVVPASAGEYWGYVGNNGSNTSVLNSNVAANRISRNEQYVVARRVVEANVRGQEANTRMSETRVVNSQIRNIDRIVDVVENGARAYSRWDRAIRGRR